MKPLTYQNGKILMMDRSAKPAQDCIFSDPMKEGVLKLHNIASYGDKKAGGMAVFNLTDRMQPFSFCPGDILDLEVAHTYRVYDYFSKKAFSLTGMKNMKEPWSRMVLAGMSFSRKVKMAPAWDFWINMQDLQQWKIYTKAATESL